MEKAQKMLAYSTFWNTIKRSEIIAMEQYLGSISHYDLEIAKAIQYINEQKYANAQTVLQTIINTNESIRKQAIERTRVIKNNEMTSVSQADL